MRSVERVFGFLAGLLGTAAVVFALTQHTVRSFTGTATYGPGVDGANTRYIILSVGLAVVASLVVALSAMQDTRSLTRGVWWWLLLLGAVICIGGIVLLITGDILVEVTQSQTSSVQISAGLIFAPAALAAIVCALAALRPRAQVARA